MAPAAGRLLREAVDALTVLLALTWVVTLACILGLVKRKGVFLRTPKAAEHVTISGEVRVATSEAVLAVLCGSTLVAVLVTGPLDLLGARTMTSRTILMRSSKRRRASTRCGCHEPIDGSCGAVSTAGVWFAWS